MRRGARTAERVALPAGRRELAIVDVAFRQDGERWLLEVRTDAERWTLQPETGAWRLAERLGVEKPVDPAWAARRAAASGRFGIYVSAYKASGRYLDEHIAFLKRHGLNSMVVDCKEDYGVVAYDTRLEWPKRIGAVRPYFKIDELVAKAHAAGIYLIGRILVFRDKGLYNAPGYPYTAWDRVSNAPWRYVQTTTDAETGETSSYQGEYWVDPYSEDVWRYNIDIAREVQDRGFDEIQFDYIRFPSDGPLSRLSVAVPEAGHGQGRGARELPQGRARRDQHPDLDRRVRLLRVGPDLQLGGAEHRGVLAVRGRDPADVLPLALPPRLPRLARRTSTTGPATIYREGSNRAAGIVDGRRPHPAVRAGLPHRRRDRLLRRDHEPLPREPGPGHRSRARPPASRSGTPRTTTTWSCSPLAPMIAAAAADRQR